MPVTPERHPAQGCLHIAFGSLVLASVAAFGQSNLGFLNNTPMAYMMQPDMKSAAAAVSSALGEKKDGESARWSNENTGDSVPIEAKITPQNTTTDGDRTCRDVTVELDAKGQSMNIRQHYCRQGGGEWKLQKQ